MASYVEKININNTGAVPIRDPAAAHTADNETITGNFTFSNGLNLGKLPITIDNSDNVNLGSSDISSSWNFNGKLKQDSEDVVTNVLASISTTETATVTTKKEDGIVSIAIGLPPAQSGPSSNFETLTETEAKEKTDYSNNTIYYIIEDESQSEEGESNGT